MTRASQQRKRSRFEESLFVSPYAVDAQRVEPESLGLMGMRERVRPLGGELEIAGTAGKGTTVRVSVPGA